MQGEEVPILNKLLYQNEITKANDKIRINNNPRIEHNATVPAESSKGRSVSTQRKQIYLVFCIKKHILRHVVNVPEHMNTYFFIFNKFPRQQLLSFHFSTD